LFFFFFDWWAVLNFTLETYFFGGNEEMEDEDWQEIRLLLRCKRFGLWRTRIEDIIIFINKNEVNTMAAVFLWDDE
jgi:hypothetical protein